MATELAKAYVQIIPSAQGIGGKISAAVGPEASTAGITAGQTFGGKLAAYAKSTIAAAAIGKFLASSLLEGAALQQSMGGIETLFKNSYDKVVLYANDAYKTTGLSANAYMEQVTGFSASLLQSLDGDTNAAAESANQALTDMSDNANKMGTNMELIQIAYQGFAKQNYTMLDNLKLGYGGTKEEMERLLADAEKISGVEYDISNLSDVYEAIHVIQTDLGITGTTAKEAASTFSGSFAMMKAAAENLMGAMSLGKDAPMELQKAMSDLLSSAVTFLINAIPMLINVVLSIPGAIFSALSQAGSAQIGPYITSMFDYVVNTITLRLPELILQGINAVGNFVMGLITGLPTLLNAAAQFVDNFAFGIDGKAPQIIETAANVVGNLITGLITNLPKIVGAATNLAISIIKAIIKLLPQFIATGGKFIIELTTGLIQKVPSLIAKIPGIISQIVAGFGKIGSKMLSVGKDIVSGIWNGISNKVGWLKNQISGFVGNVTTFLKKLFKIGSPSKLMRDEVGIFLAEGIGVGFTQGMGYVQKEMEASLPRSFDVSPTLAYNAGLNKTASGSVNDITALGAYIINAVAEQGQQIANSLENGISNMRMVSDGRETARFIAGLGFAKG